MSRSKRISKELEELQKDQNSMVSLELISDDLSHLKGTILGPPDTPYEGGEYQIDIRVPIEYPFKPPIMKFDTRVYHPNISSQTGAICLDILKDAWTAILSLRSCLISLQALLQSPEPNDPQDAVVAREFLSHRDRFDATAREWAVKYAGAPREGKEGNKGRDEGNKGRDEGNKGRDKGKQRDSGNGPDVIVLDDDEPEVLEDLENSEGLKGGKKVVVNNVGKPVETVETVEIEEPDEVEIYGLDRQLVAGFVDMGFPIQRVVEVLRSLRVESLAGMSPSRAEETQDKILMMLLG